jgi:hypothetical protein
LLIPLIGGQIMILILALDFFSFGNIRSAVLMLLGGIS